MSEHEYLQQPGIPSDRTPLTTTPMTGMVDGFGVPVRKWECGEENQKRTTRSRPRTTPSATGSNVEASRQNAKASRTVFGLRCVSVDLFKRLSIVFFRWVLLKLQHTHTHNRVNLHPLGQRLRVRNESFVAW